MNRPNAKAEYLGLTILALMTFGVHRLTMTAQASGSDTSVALPAEQFVNAIHSAVKAKPGHVLSVEAETEKGVTLCDVKILSTDGKAYEVEVEAKTGKVVGIESDDEKDDAKEEKEGPEKE